jgi:nucleotide-binding universal stress UspA family protein
VAGVTGAAQDHARGGVRAGRADGRSTSAGGEHRGGTGGRRADPARRAGREPASAADHKVIAGTIKSELLREAREWPADLVVLGSRERHGLALIVNLTEDAVLHAAPCDVLALRLPASCRTR